MLLTENKPANIIEALHRDDLFAPFVKGKNMEAWETFLKILYGLELDDQTEKETAWLCTQRADLSNGFQEAYAICGRRGGKSSCAALIAVWEALFSGQAEQLSPGEKGYIFCIATDRNQAGIVLSYIRAILSNFEEIIDKDLAWNIHLRNNVIISIRPAAYRGIRGYSILAIVADEIAFWRDENSANPAQEVIDSLLPGLKENGKLLGLSTPYARSGYLWEMHEENYGKEGSPILSWKASTQTMHPNFKQSIINRLMKRRGKEKTLALRSEYAAEFRADIETFITMEEFETAVLKGIPQIPAMISNNYKAFVDPSGGKKDSFTLGIAHHDEGGFAALDLIFEIRAPFNPEDAVDDIVEILRKYRCSSVTGDRYSGNWVQSSFRKRGIIYHESKLDKNGIFSEFQALLAMRKLMLIDNKRLQQQCCGLERRTRTRTGGKDSIDHPPGGKDDLINSAAGACQLIFQEEIATRITKSEMSARMPSLGKQRRHPNKRLDAAEEMHEIMINSGCNQIVRKKLF